MLRPWVGLFESANPGLSDSIPLELAENVDRNEKVS
jgi:hypothetical protein